MDSPCSRKLALHIGVLFPRLSLSFFSLSLSLFLLSLSLACIGIRYASYRQEGAYPPDWGALSLSLSLVWDVGTDSIYMGELALQIGVLPPLFEISV